jgi:hypothetical protein
MRLWLVAVLIAVFGVLGAVGFPHIAPKQACWSMRPSHRGSPQTSTAPFRILAPATYRPGQELEVTLNATGSRTFKGFLLEARTTRGAADTVGTFRAINPATQVYCDNEALCHNSAHQKTLIKGMWRAPATAVGPIVFRATFVANFDTCWVGVTSAQVSPST